MYELTPLHIIGLPILGLILSAMGTLVGLGGGFVLVPVLLVLFPEAPPTIISSISLTVVFVNAVAATVGNLRARRIDLRTASLLAVGAVPAAVAGAYASNLVSRSHFETYFGVMLLLGAVYVLWRAASATPLHSSLHDPNREIRERGGPVYRFYVNALVAGIISPLGGFLSSFFGIGGGVIHVPAMTFLLNMPTPVVSATSLFVLVPTSLAGVLARMLAGQYTQGWRRAGLLGLGAIVGAQIGVHLSTRVNQRVTLTILAIGMVLVGARQLLAGI